MPLSPDALRAAWRRLARARRWTACGRAGWLLAPLLLLASAPTHAVTFTEQIERLQAIYDGLLDYRPGGPPLVLPAWHAELGVELVPIPPIDNQVGAKKEPVNPPPAYGRLRAQVGVGGGFAFGIAYLPPIRLNGYSSDLLGGSLDYGFRHGEFLAGLRAYYLQGKVRGPITDPNTSDTFTLQNTGADARLGWAIGTWILYGGAGSGQSRTRLDVASDGSSSAYAAPYGYAFAGASWAAGPWRLSLEQQQTQSYLRHLVLTGFYGF